MTLISSTSWANANIIKCPFLAAGLCTVFENHRKSLILASEVSYIYILSGQKFIENVKNGPFWRVFENLKLAVNFNRTKNWWKLPKFKCVILSDFQTMCNSII